MAAALRVAPPSLPRLQVLRASLLFVWRNERGEPWRDVIRSSARTEFEATRCDEIVNTLLALFLTRAPSFLNDPEQVNRLLLTGRDCLDQAVEKVSVRSVKCCHSAVALRSRTPRSCSSCSSGRRSSRTRKRSASAASAVHKDLKKAERVLICSDVSEV